MIIVFSQLIGDHISVPWLFYNVAQLYICVESLRVWTVLHSILRYSKKKKRRNYNKHVVITDQ